MSFRCPQCLTLDGLEIKASIELPPDRRSQEISLQVLGCKACKFTGLAVYEEARGSFVGAESFTHIGYWVSPDAVESVICAIRMCPQPSNRGCDCPAHTALGQKDLDGLWRGLREMDRGHTFLMRLHLG